MENTPPPYRLHHLLSNVADGIHSSIACNNSHLIFVGSGGVLSTIVVLEIEDITRSPIEVGRLYGMNGSILSMVINQPEENKLAACTSSGKVYIWDISDAGIERLKEQTSLLEAMDCNILPESFQFQPLASISSESSGNCTSVDFLQDGVSLIVVGRYPGEFIAIHNSLTGEKIATINRGFKVYVRNRLGETNNFSVRLNGLNCVSTDTSVGQLGNGGEIGKWVAFGDSLGNVGILFVSDKELNRIKNACEERKFHPNSGNDFTASSLEVVASAFPVCDLYTEIKAISWIPKRAPTDAALSLALGCSDGFVRFFNVRYENDKFVAGDCFLKKFCHGDCLGEVRSLTLSSESGDNSYIVACCNSVKRNGRNQHEMKDIETSLEAPNKSSDCFFEVKCHTTNNTSRVASMSCIFRHRRPILDVAIQKGGNIVAAVGNDGGVCIFGKQIEK